MEQKLRVGIIGATGSGKSTFVQHLNALLKVPSAEKKYKEKKYSINNYINYRTNKSYINNINYK